MMDVVVVVFNPKPVAYDCIKAMRRHNTGMGKLILVDNFSTNTQVVELVKPLVDMYIRPDKQISLAAAWNLGIKHSTTPYVLISNDDILVTENWLSPLIGGLERNETIGVLQPYNTISRLPDNFPDNYRTEDKINQIPRDNFVGCCFAINTAIYADLKQFDKETWPDDWDGYTYFYEPLYPFGAEDQDFYERVRRAGYKTLTHFGSYIHHYTGETMKDLPDFEEIKERGNQTFRERWQHAKAR